MPNSISLPNFSLPKSKDEVFDYIDKYHSLNYKGKLAWLHEISYSTGWICGVCHIQKMCYGMEWFPGTENEIHYSWDEEKLRKYRDFCYYKLSLLTKLSNTWCSSKVYDETDSLKDLVIKYCEEFYKSSNTTHSFITHFKNEFNESPYSYVSSKILSRKISNFIINRCHGEYSWDKFDAMFKTDSLEEFENRVKDLRYFIANCRCTSQVEQRNQNHLLALLDKLIAKYFV